MTTQYKKLSGPKSTGEKIDLAQFNKPKKKKEEKKKEEKSAESGSAEAKKKRRRISKVGSPSQKNGQGFKDGRGGNKFKGRGQRRFFLLSFFFFLFLGFIKLSQINFFAGRFRS